MKKWLKEPLVHFLFIGAMIFFVFFVVNPEEAQVNARKIVISAADIERLSVNWSKSRNRPPTEDELQNLVDSYIREEVFYREALALGLDQEDTILRRRMVQKMEFLSNDLAELHTPDEIDLNEYFLGHQDRYELPARVSFTHIYFSHDKHGSDTLQLAENVLAELRNASAPLLRAPERGDPFMFQYDFTLESPFVVARMFGESFAEQLFQAKINGWQGPINSGYGLHLVRINEKVDARMPELSSVIDKVRTDWMFEKRKETNRNIYEKFKERYEIVVEMPDQPGVKESKAAGRRSS